MSLVEEVKRELDEMSRIGIFVPAAAYQEAEDANEYEGLSVSEIASLCLELV